MFSKACMYAIRAVVLMASDNGPGTRWNLERIVQGTDAPPSFMAKVLQQLVHAGMVESTKGPGGGFSLSPEIAAGLRLKDVVVAIDGDFLLAGCALGFPKCDARKPCPVHDEMTLIRERLDAMLSSTEIQRLGAELLAGEVFLRNKR
ncbi:MAG: Rrf2 family transcriptional regulator [Flavobacteriales bacterium]|nr:Rrf2 family transcriptional regulator [Flavobacteriales bacterium]